MADSPRTFEQVVADTDPTERDRTARIETFTRDYVEINLFEDRDEPGAWRVEYFDGDGGCYVTIFAGPRAERRARDYFDAFKSGRLEIVCEERGNGQC